LAQSIVLVVVDDDPTQRDLIRRFLTKEGFTLRTANGARQGCAWRAN
jgi:DNA-binding NtrC family response regulator